jgi:large subunit ribosomal protein L17
MTNLKYRHLSRDSAHRKALLRNLCSSLLEHETITTTWPRAKEAQRWVEKLITLGKRNTNASRTKATDFVFDEHKHLPKVFGELRERYANRAGGYTRVLRTESQETDQAPSAILSLVDGPKDMRFYMTAKAIAKSQAEGKPLTEITAMNMHKVTKFRKNGEKALEAAVEQLTLQEEALQANMKKEFDKDQTAYQWRRGPGHKAGPGKVVRRMVDKALLGDTPAGFKRKYGDILKSKPKPYVA